MSGPIIDYVGDVKMIVGGLICFLVLFVLGVWLSYTYVHSLIFFELLGFFYSYFWPAYMGCVMKIFGDQASDVTGVIMVIMTALNICLNLLLGKMSDLIHFSIPFLSGIPIAVLAIVWMMLVYCLYMKHLPIRDKKESQGGSV